MHIEQQRIRNRIVRGWAFMNLEEGEAAAIRRFLESGNTEDLPRAWQRKDFTLYFDPPKRKRTDAPINALVTVDLDACSHTELFDRATPEGVWMRVNTLESGYTGWPEVQLFGRLGAVREFIKDHWGEEQLEAVQFIPFKKEEA